MYPCDSDLVDNAHWHADDAAGEVVTGEGYVVKGM